MRRKHRNQKFKWIRSILLICILLISSVSVYAFYQYKQGQEIGKSGNFEDDELQTGSFQGEEVEFGKINLLLLGSDSRGEKSARTDSIMIAHYNQETHESKVISIMRDTYVDIPGHGKQKINAAYAYGGVELLRETIKNNFDIDLHYYAVVDFEGFSKVTDIIAPDGIEVDVPYEMSYGIGTTINPGRQILHGDQLLGYVRFRHDKLSDFGRVERQLEVIGKLKNQAMSISSIVKLPKIIGVIEPYVDTNLDTSVLFSLGKDLIMNPSPEIKTMRIPVKDSFTDKRFDGVGAVLSINLEQNMLALNEFLS